MGWDFFFEETIGVDVLVVLVVLVAFDILDTTTSDTDGVGTLESLTTDCFDDTETGKIDGRSDALDPEESVDTSELDVTIFDTTAESGLGVIPETPSGGCELTCIKHYMGQNKIKARQ